MERELQRRDERHTEQQEAEEAAQELQKQVRARRYTLPNGRHVSIKRRTQRAHV